MNKFSKKTVFGITTAAAAAAALAVGMAGPAMASTGHDGPLKASGNRSASSSQTTLTQAQWDALHNVTTGLTAGLTGGDVSNTSPIVVSPGLNVGDVASGNAIGSGNSSDSALLSGNSTSAGNNDGNGSANGNGSSNADGNSVTSDVQKLVKNVTSGSGNSSKSSTSSSASSSKSSTSTNASDIVNNVLNGLGLDH
jgi:hypothetical protein